jgi:hypothetical protein
VDLLTPQQLAASDVVKNADIDSPYEKNSFSKKVVDTFEAFSKKINFGE